MLQNTSVEFRKFFLLSFTKELIKNSSSEIYELEGIVNQDTKEKQQKRENPLTNKEFKKILSRKFDDFSKLKAMEERPIFKPLPVLRIPEPKLPPSFFDVRPVPTPNQLDLNKLNVLINDPKIEMLECNGGDSNIIVSGKMGRKSTEITLNTDEIKQVIRTFSEAARIPLNEGIFKIAFGRLVLSAINSEVVDSKFIIRKLPPPLEIPRRFY